MNRWTRNVRSLGQTPRRPFLAQSGHHLSPGNVRYWPKADMSGSGLLPCKLTPEPHFASRKSLL
jgi:hypothetical protein